MSSPNKTDASWTSPLSHTLSAALSFGSKQLDTGAFCQYLDPLSTVICLAAAAYLPSGARVDLGSGTPTVSEAGWWQTLSRTVATSGREHLHNLLPALRKALNVYKPWQNEQYRELFQSAAKGLVKLGKYYKVEKLDRNTFVMLLLIAEALRRKAESADYEFPEILTEDANEQSPGEKIVLTLLADEELDHKLKEAWQEATIDLVCRAVHNAAELELKGRVHGSADLIMAPLEKQVQREVEEAISEAIERAERTK